MEKLTPEEKYDILYKPLSLDEIHSLYLRIVELDGSGPPHLSHDETNRVVVTLDLMVMVGASLEQSRRVPFYDTFYAVAADIRKKFLSQTTEGEADASKKTTESITPDNFRKTIDQCFLLTVGDAEKSLEYAEVIDKCRKMLRRELKQLPEDARLMFRLGLDLVDSQLIRAVSDARAAEVASKTR